jgi:hypothetical protein
MPRTYATKHKLEIGRRFGSRVVVADAGRDGHGQRLWRVRCDCGGEADVLALVLIKGRSVTCMACTRRKQSGAGGVNWRGVGRVPGTAYRNFVAQAERRGIEWSLTIEFVADLFEKQGGKCALTGWPLEFFRGAHHGRGNASIDRIDSASGYVPGNVWIVHKNVNFAKQSLSVDDFVAMCRAVTEKFNGAGH